MQYPDVCGHWIAGRDVYPQPREHVPKFAPATGEIICDVICGTDADLSGALAAAEGAFPEWSARPVEERAGIIRTAADLILTKKDECAAVLALECGRPDTEVAGEVGSAHASGVYFSGLLEQFEPVVLKSTNPKRVVNLVRDPIGVGALFVPFNTPLAQIAAKAFPALLSGNAVILKAHEYVPYTPILFAHILKEAGVPDGVFNVLQGVGAGIGAAIVAEPRIQFISFTGSSVTGARIVAGSAGRLAKVSVEAGGKNPFIVCDDANLEKALADGIASAFVDSGQRCAAATRFLVFEGVYDEFIRMFVEKTKGMRIGVGDADMGALISGEKMKSLIAQIEAAKDRGVIVQTGGARALDMGFFMQPTVLENVGEGDLLWRDELFGPVAIFKKVTGYDEALRCANDSPYRLSSAIHTQNAAMGERFARDYRTGVVRINGPTFGSEPSMPFGGPGLSGNGWREPGFTALDFYSEYKQISRDI